MDGTEVVQLYVRDRVGSIIRPVKELKGFQRVNLKAGESKVVRFVLSPDDLSFYGMDMIRKPEPGYYTVWVGEVVILICRRLFYWNDIFDCFYGNLLRGSFIFVR